MRNFIDWLGVITAPMREWKFGEDGKYIHILLGIIGVAFIFALAKIISYDEINLVGLSLFAAIEGVAIEQMQKLRGGNNTTWETVFDAFWVWFGGTVLAGTLYYFGIITLYYI